MENRYKLPSGVQRAYLIKVERVSGLSSERVAPLFGVVGRSYRDWRREKYAITQRAVEVIEQRFNLSFPYSRVKAFAAWNAIKIEQSRKGALAVIKKYGFPGTPEGRVKGGKHAMVILRARGLIPASKPFVSPKKFSAELAEFIGIMLGDGHVGEKQWSIALNSIADKEYSQFVINLVERLFSFNPTSFLKKDRRAIIIVGSGSRSIQYFQHIGLKVGNKVKLQVGVPQWIGRDKLLSISCLRGLMDTDGGIFIHRYRVKGKEYSYQKLCFANRSIPLLIFVYDTLKSLNLNPKMVMKMETKYVWLYNQRKAREYLDKVGTDNPRLLKNINGGVR